MAVRIEKGGWIFIFLLGLVLVGYGLDKYGVIDLSGWFGKGAGRSAGRPRWTPPSPSPRWGTTNPTRCAFA